MSFHLVKLVSWALLSCLLLDYYVPLARVSSARIPDLPDSLRAQTQLVYLDATRLNLFKIDEFISRSDGSIRLDVTKHANGSSWDQAIKTTYFRLFQGTKRPNNDDRLDTSMVSLDLRTGECRTEHTSNWILGDYSFLLSKVAVHMQTSDDESVQDRVSIGPTALLQIVYKNPALFRLDSQAYEDILMADAYYFSASLDEFYIDDEGSRAAKLIVAVQADRVEFAHDASGSSKKSKLVGTPLSQVNLSDHPAMVALVLLTGSPKDSKLKSFELLRSLKSSDWPKNETPPMGLIVSYDLIQERSLSRHSALEQLSDELANPFQLPAGCGMLAPQRPLYVNARQFSGQFEALGFEQKFAVAYDRATNHLRYDSLDEFKLIYSLSEQVATFVSTARQPLTMPSRGPASKSQKSAYYHQAHQNKERCTQTNIVNERGVAFGSRSWLFDKNSLEDILGLGDQVGLMYLGQKRLPADEDDELMLCQVFEREVSAAQIPALLGMHTRQDLETRERRFYLVFYLVDEINSLSENERDGWQSMWLKRVELVAIDSHTKYQLVAARLSFSSFSWSLESVETSDALTSRQTELTHPVRTFDTLECWSERGQLRVDFLLKRVNDHDWDEALKGGGRLKSSMQMLSSFEETVLALLERILIMPRSQINELRIVAPAMKALDSELESDTSNSLTALGNLWVSFKITKPFNYLYKRTLVGWIESYSELLHANQAKFVKYKISMAKHECSSQLVTQLGQPHSIHMLHCPNIGCAYLTVNKLEDIKYMKLQEVGDSENVARSGPPFGDSFHMCEIHQLLKTMSMREIEGDVYKAEVIERYLSQSSLMIYANNESQETAQQAYRAHVTKLSLLDVVSRHDLWDEELIYGLCFSVNMSSEFYDKSHREQGKRLRVIQLDFDQHHSRAHCRRACLLYQFCQTYSYQRASRQCTLANIHRRHFVGPKLNSNVAILESSLDCSIYALDQAVLYKRSSSFELKMPAELFGDKSVLLLNTSLTHCASLCHMNEFAVDERTSAPEQSAIDCQSFNYLSLSSLCVLKNTGQEFDNRSGLVKREEYLAGPEEWEARIGGRQQMYESSLCESYTRNYASYFSSRYGIKIHLDGPTQEDGWLDDGQPEKVLKGVGLNECQRECAMLDEDCAALDYCLVNEKGIQVELDSQPHPAGRVFGKLQLEAKNSLLRQLTHDEKLFYLEGQSNNHKLVIHSRNCNHYYLDGNDLHLKRLLAKSARNYLEEKSIEQLVKRDAATSRLAEAFLTSVENLRDQINLRTFTSGLQMLSKICAGFFVGLLVFLLQPSVAQLSNKLDLIRSLKSLRWFHSFRSPAARPRTDRTMSMVDIVELADVDSL